MKEAKAVLKQYFGYKEFRPMQEEVINSIISGKDTMVLMPTGGGKSLCFQIPALVQSGICIVVSPLIALMRDQVDGLRGCGVPAAFLNSSLHPEEQSEIFRMTLSGEIKLLYVSPERLLTDFFMSFLEKLEISLFAVDESHCISSWGHDFRPEYVRLKELREKFPNVPIAALTATADEVTRKDILKQLKMDNPAVFISSFDRPNIRITVKPAQKRMEKIVDFVKSKSRQSGIIYCLSRNGTETLAAKLRDKGITAAYYHAGMESAQRDKVQRAFIKDDVKIICATIAFGMGIDKSNIRWVIHYNLPKNIEGYYQQIGRACRDGLDGEALLFYTYRDYLNLENLIGEKKNSEVELRKLGRMKAFAETGTCRRRFILEYFNETAKDQCDNCDNCLEPGTVIDGTIIAQKALSAMYRIDEEITITRLIQVLRGEGSRAILEKGYNKIKTFGVGNDISQKGWDHYIRQIVRLGYIKMTKGRNLELRHEANNVLFHKEQVQLKAYEFGSGDYRQQMTGRTVPLTYSEELFELLRELRKDIADEKGCPPYIVFSDASLKQMAEMQPQTKDAMMEISGVGEVKFKLYGDQFMDTIKKMAVGV